MKAHRVSPDRVAFQCPGCKTTHEISDAPGRWKFNGDFARPTFTPSVLVTNGHHVPNFKPEDNCWCKYNAEHPNEQAPFTCNRCHSFVTDGRIQFLADSTHALAGQTVELPEWEAL